MCAGCAPVAPIPLRGAPSHSTPWFQLAGRGMIFAFLAKGRNHEGMQQCILEVYAGCDFTELFGTQLSSRRENTFEPQSR